MRVLVVGAGVIGLSCAVRLLEAGHRVDVVARDLPHETTSARAAALWYPYLAFPHEQVLGWARRSYAVFDSIAGSTPLDAPDAPVPTGVRMLAGTEAHLERADDPWWLPAVSALERTSAPEGFGGAWSFVSPVVDMPVYLGWLRARVEALGGTVTRLNLSALPAGGDLVVNCSAIGSRLLADDAGVQPVAGQVVHLEPFGLDRWWLCGDADDGEPTYVVPRGDCVVVGGTARRGEWSRTPSARTTTSILERAARLVPEVADARVLREQVGLRPARPEVRVERVGRVIHCYGHGGAGVTLSWGCADDVVALAEQGVTA